MSELVLIVGDVPRAVSFYSELVGLRLERPADDRWAWFRLSDAPVQRLALTRGPLMFEEFSPLAAGRRFGPVHFAFQASPDVAGAAVGRLDAAGVRVHGPVRIDWMRSVSHYFFDPDGNQVELWTPDPAPEPSAC